MSAQFGRSGGDVRLGGAMADELMGGKGVAILIGRGGPDHLCGGDGPDLLIGGTIDGALRGGDARDTLDEGEGADHASAIAFAKDQGRAVSPPPRLEAPRRRPSLAGRQLFFQGQGLARAYPMRRPTGI